MADDEGKVNVYNIAEKGVNVTDDAIHLTDGELTKAQNIQPDPVIARGAVRRRDGMARLNSSAMAGAVTGLIGLPLPDRSTLTRYFYAPWDDREDKAQAPTTNAYRRSSDGTTWATITTSSINKPQQRIRMGQFGVTDLISGMLAYARLNNRYYFPGNDYVSSSDGGTQTQPTIHVFDGTNEYVLSLIPEALNTLTSVVGDGITSIVPYSDRLLIVGMFDGSDGSNYANGRVFLLDVATGQLYDIGQETLLAGMPIHMVVYQGSIYVCTFVANLTQGLVYRARVGDATWTTDSPTIENGRGFTSLCVFKGNLYVGSSAAWGGAGTTARIYKRTATTAAWTTALTADGTGTGNFLGPMIVTSDGGTMLVGWSSVSGGAAPACRISSTTDGASYSTAYDVSTNVGANYNTFGHPSMDSNGDIYWVVMQSADGTSKIIKRTAAGSFSIVDNAASLFLRGPITAFKF